MIIAIWTQCEPDLTYIKIDELTLTQDIRVKCFVYQEVSRLERFQKTFVGCIKIGVHLINQHNHCFDIL